MADVLLAAGAYCEFFILLSSVAAPFIVRKVKSERFKKLLTTIFGVLIVLGILAAVMAERLMTYHEGDWLGFFMFYMFVVPIEIFMWISCAITAFWRRNGLYLLLFAPVVFMAFYLSLVFF